MSSSTPIVFRKGKRVYLSPMQKEDLPLITVWINDQEVNQYLTVAMPMTLQDEEKWFESLESDKPHHIILAIRLTDTNEIIGIQGLHKVSYRDGTAVMGYFIGRKDLWGQGYGTEAQMLLLEYAFNTLNLHKVSAEVYDFNPRSKKCLEKCGYVEEGIQREHRFRNGRRADCHLLAVFRKEFLPRWENYSAEFLKAK
jgi:RimJ/RimL family protein N-acetyltransferase